MGAAQCDVGHWLILDGSGGTNNPLSSRQCMHTTSVDGARRSYELQSYSGRFFKGSKYPEKIP